MDEDHNVRISLSVPAPTWFHFLSQLTDAICFVRTPVVVLASDGPVPAMNGSGDPVLRAVEAGTESDDLALSIAAVDALYEADWRGFLDPFLVS